MPVPRVRLRGLRQSIPAGYVVGRLKGGVGDAQLISIRDLGQQAVSTGAVPAAGSSPPPYTVVAGTGINVSLVGSAYTISNTGVLSNIAGSGINVSGGTGNVTISNTGVLSAVAGSGIGVSGATGNVTFSNTGVLSISGTSNRITASAGTGAVTLDISSSYVGQASITTLGTIGTGTWAGTTIAVNHGGTGQTSYTDGQLLIGNTATGGLTPAAITAGTNITITNGNGSILIDAASSGLSAIADLRMLANISGSPAVPIATTNSAWMDATLGSTQGNTVYRSSGAWTVLAPPTNSDDRLDNIKALVSYVPVAGGGQTTTWKSIGHYVWKRPSSVATTTALPACTYNNGTGGIGATLTANANGAIGAVDGLTLDLTVNNTVLVKNQSNQIQNGAYWVTQVGDATHPWIFTRRRDANDYDSFSTAMYFPVATGTTNGMTIWQSIISAPTTFGSDNISFVLMASSTVISNGKYNIGCYVPGLLTSSQGLLYHKVSKAMTIPANFGSNLGHTSQAGGSSNATGSTVILVDKALAASPNSFSNIGSITIGAGGVTATFATVGGVSVSFAQGDVLRIAGPASADASFAGFYGTIVGYET